MYISKLRIKNFRNFSDPPFTMDLRPFTLILGENNIGKTNLLAAISLLYSQEISAIQRRNLEIDDINYLAVTAFKKQVTDQAIAADKVLFPEVEIHAVISDIQENQHPVVGDWYSNRDLTKASVTYRFSVRGNFKRAEWIKEQRKAIARREKQDEEENPEPGAASGKLDYSRYVDFPIGEYRHTIYGGGRPSNECESWLLRMLCVEILDALRDAGRELVAGGEQRLLYRVLRHRSDSGYTDVKKLIEDLKQAIDADPSLASIKAEVQKLLALVSLATPGEDHSIGMQFVAPEASEILKKIGLYVVGDPEQYVSGYTYRGRKPPAFDNIPFFKFRKQAELRPIVENHRSNGEIVTFANQFRKDMQQIPVKPFRKEPRVLFIPATSLEEIVCRYQALSANVETEKGKHRTRLYLSEENATFEPVRDQFQLTPISNDGRKANILLGDALELLSVALDRSQRRVCEEFKLSRLQWRAVGIQLLREIRTGQYGIEQLNMFITDTFSHKVSDRAVKEITKGLDLLGNELAGGDSTQVTELYASIRKAKGLEADAALVVAKSAIELKKWLQTDHTCRVADRQDKCRLGYVAFTRPKEMLCIACLKELDEELTLMLLKLGIEIVPDKANEKSPDSEIGFIYPNFDSD